MQEISQVSRHKIKQTLFQIFQGVQLHKEGYFIGKNFLMIYAKIRFFEFLFLKNKEKGTDLVEISYSRAVIFALKYS